MGNKRKSDKVFDAVMNDIRGNTPEAKKRAAEAKKHRAKMKKLGDKADKRLQRGRDGDDVFDTGMFD